MATEIWSQRLAQQAQIRPGGRVLLVDDDLQDLNYYCGVLRARGCEVVACVSPEDALRFLEAGRFELILVCQGSSAFEGRSVLERAIEIDRHTPVIVLTRCLSMDCYLEAMQLGAVDYLEKPVPPEQIAWVLETRLRHSSAQA